MGWIVDRLMGGGVPDSALRFLCPLTLLGVDWTDTIRENIRGILEPGRDGLRLWAHGICAKTLDTSTLTRVTLTHSVLCTIRSSRGGI